MAASKRGSQTAPASGRAGAQGGIDHDVLNRLLCDDLGAVKEVLRQFLASCPEDSQGLRAALAKADWPATLRCAHRLKGACRMVGANLLADVCEHLERAVNGRDARLIGAAAEELERESGRVQTYLRSWLRAS